MIGVSGISSEKMTLGNSTFGNRLRNLVQKDWFSIVLWAIFAGLVVVTKLHLKPTSGNVFNIYRNAGLAWLAGEPLFEDGRFHYFPISAVLFTPWANVSFVLGGAIWRTLNIALFALGIWRFSRSIHSEDEQTIPGAFAIVTLFATALSWTAARHGQTTLSMAGLMLICMASLIRGGKTSPVVALALAVAAKPLALLLAPVLIAIRPSLLPRCLIAVAVVIALPFAFQDPSYVFDQYLVLPETLQAHADSVQVKMFTDAIACLHLLGLESSSFEQSALRICAGILVIGLCVEAKRSFEFRDAAPHIAALVFGFILLLCPGTERNSYALIAPVIGILFVMAKRDRLLWAQTAYLGAATLFLLSNKLFHAFPDSIIGMPKPLACILVVSVSAIRVAGQSKFATLRSLRSESDLGV